ncbi:MAG TPA: citrate (Si)-synthase [Thermoanaerobaculia bacterium]|nr:citrate (Si)-synthase [Thermoanaerobaculia bacterium]HUM28576.1 citrate (Si)-synthase [Thermoanaerobaculia bacterium]HXK66816.1 citrate (Si)-synthase [Thermoanaerobaculia bacterium]
MATLQNKLAELIPPLREELKAMGKDHGDMVISDVTIAQAYGGMRGVKAMICDTSFVSPDKGLHIRGIPLLEIKDLWPEEIFYLLLTGDKPDDEAKCALQKDFDRRSHVPEYVWDVLESMHPESHPMAMLSTAICAMEVDSVFRKMYDEGMKKEDYWVAALEDALQLLAKLPSVAAYIYRLRFGKGDRIPWVPGLDWGANYANMLGIPDPHGHFARLMRLYLNFHSDHEGGNVSANTCHTVGSALSDPYYAVAAGLNGLAGPLHGLANQECLKWILDMMDKIGGLPTEDQIRQYTWDTLNSGQVVPGYGHAVLRCPDPRFVGFNEFGRKYLPNDPVFQAVDRVFKVVPDVLKEHGKAKNPWPNVDAGSGALLYHFGLREFSYYTVLFAVSRSMGMLAQLIYNRAIMTAITRPKSVTTEWIKGFIKEKA